MKIISFLLLVPAILFASEINPELQTKKVIVYLSGAQLTNETTITIPQGRTSVLFSNLSPNIDPNSIRIKGLDGITIASLNFAINYLEKGTETEKIQQLESLLDDENRKLVLIKNRIIGLQQEEDFLKNNTQLNTTKQSAPLPKLIEYSTYYRERISKIRTEIYDAGLKETDLQKEINDLRQQINKERSKNIGERGEIKLLLDAPKQTTLNLTVIYNVSNAGWFPTYDIKTKNTEEPLKFFYKANVYQETGKNWNKVSLTLSTGDPTLNTEKPIVEPYYLNFVNPSVYRRKNKTTQNLNYRYNPTIKMVSGKVKDDQGMPLAGVNIVETGTRNGTQTDFDGNYSLKITGGRSLEYSYIGYISPTIPIYSGRMNITMTPDASQLQEVVVTGYGISRDSGYQTEQVKIPAVTKSENPVTTLFKITEKYSIPSTSETTIVTIDEFNIPAEYEYYSAPLLNPQVFLTAKLKDWEGYDILPGEANIYFAGSFAGTTYLQPIQTDEEMVISLGVDASIAVERKRINNLKDKSFFGNTRIISRNYEIILKNNKTVPVEITLLDRVPISQNKEIEVEELEYGNASFDKKTGVVTWKVNLSEKGSAKRELKYEVKYPKDRYINLN